MGRTSRKRRNVLENILGLGFIFPCGHMDTDQGFRKDLYLPVLNKSSYFSQGELLVGVLDKQHYGATQYGLVHSCFELYGHKVGVQILSCFSRLFTTYLQVSGQCWSCTKCQRMDFNFDTRNF